MRDVGSAARRRLRSVDQFCRDYSIGKSSAYRIMAAGELRYVMFGGKRLIPDDASEEWMRSLERAAAPPARDNVSSAA